MKKQALGRAKRQDKEGSENAKTKEDKKSYKNDQQKLKRRNPNALASPLHPFMCALF